MKIQIIDDFLKPEDLLKYQNYVINSKLKQTIIKDDAFTTEFWNTYGEKLNQHFKEMHFSGVYPQVTISHSNKPITKHTDGKLEDEKYKILIYLNTVLDGGTKFYDETTYTVENRMNRLVVFDIRLPHEGQKFVINSIKKMTIGFRPRQ
jgi:hypothetical protein